MKEFDQNGKCSERSAMDFTSTWYFSMGLPKGDDVTFFHLFHIGAPPDDAGEKDDCNDEVELV